MGDMDPKTGTEPNSLWNILHKTIKLSVTWLFCDVTVLSPSLVFSHKTSNLKVRSTLWYINCFSVGTWSEWQNLQSELKVLYRHDVAALD